MYWTLLLVIGCSPAPDAEVDTVDVVDTDSPVEEQPCEVYEGDLFVTNARGFATLEGVCEVTGHLEITGTNSKSLKQLEGLTGVGQSLTIRENEALTSVDGLSGLTSVGGDAFEPGELVRDRGLDIAENPLLADIDGLSGLESVLGSLSIENNEVLVHLDGLSGLRYAGSLSLFSNDKLADINALHLLESVDYGLSVSYNNSLRNVNGLGGIRSLGLDLHMIGNYRLENIDGLAITSVGGDLMIADNDRLCQSDVDAFVATVDVEGEATVAPNVPGC